MKQINVRVGQVTKITSKLLSKRVCAAMVTGIFLLFFQAKIIAQSANAIPTKSITPYPIAVSYNKTSNLIFPYAIKSVDRGSASVLAQKAKGVDNILQVKAGKQNFHQTNLTVVTTDGQLYSFLVDYTNEPSVLNFSFSKDSVSSAIEPAEKDKAVLSGTPLNEAGFKTITDEVCQQKRFLHIRSREQKMRLSLESLWLKDKVMWLALQLQNKSLIDYSPDYIRFFVRDKKRGKRTAIQESEITPLYGKADSTVAGEQLQKVVFAFRPFTIPKTQELVIQVGEQNGGRSLVLPVSHKVLLKARLLSVYATGRQ
jgi:conjugative transposon TraN protein